MGLFDAFKSQPSEQEMMMQAQQQTQPLDPMHAAALGRNWGDENYSYGIANLTLDNKRVIEEFRARLRGFEIQRRVDASGNELEPKIIKFGEPFMNEIGVNHLCGLLESIMSKNIILSNVPKEQERQIILFCKVWGRTVIAQIAITGHRWEIDTSRRDSLPTEITTMLWFAMMRAHEDGERKKLYPTQKNVSTQNLVHNNNNSPNKTFGFG